MNRDGARDSEIKKRDNVQKPKHGRVVAFLHENNKNSLGPLGAKKKNKPLNARGGPNSSVDNFQLREKKEGPNKIGVKRPRNLRGGGGHAAMLLQETRIVKESQGTDLLTIVRKVV